MTQVCLKKEWSVGCAQQDTKAASLIASKCLGPQGWVLTGGVLRTQGETTQAQVRHQSKAISLMVCSTTNQAICFAL